MNAPERHAPCPCGSGKKYKNCCERREIVGRQRSEAHRGALPRAVEWLGARYAKEVRTAIARDYVGHLPEALRSEVDRLPEQLAFDIQANGTEWLVAEGSIEVRRGSAIERARVSNLVLGPGGPLLLAEQRAFLEAMTRIPIRPYEVLESVAGEGLRLRDLATPGAESVWVRERSGSAYLVPGDVFGARLVPVQDHVELSGAIYDFPGRVALDLPDELRELLADIGQVIAGPPEDREEIVALGVAAFVIRRWLLSRVRPPEMPRPMDASTGEPLMLVTDHYEVLDWDVLERAFAAEPDVEGDRKDGWVRFKPGGDAEGMRRSLLAINLGEQPNRLEPFARTQRLADEGKAWLRRVAGDSIRFVLRDSVDPMALLAQRRGAGVVHEPDGAALRGLPYAKPAGPPPEQITAISQQFHQQQYVNWADEPIPALADRTPRDAMKTPEGRDKVLRLLRTYEGGELRRAREEGREPADLGFLWRQLGVKRE
jgi:hypothetical protein